MWKKRNNFAARHLPIFLTLIAAVGIRWKYLYVERLWPDEALYAWCGQRIYEAPGLLFSKEIIAFHPPLFPALLALGHFFFPPEIACRVVALLINIAGIAGVYWVGMKMQRFFLAIFSALALAFHYFFMSQANAILADVPLTVCLVFVIMALLRVDDRSPQRYDVYVGIWAAASILLKWSGLLVIPLVGLYYFFALPKLLFLGRLKKSLSPLIIMLSTTFFLLWNNWVQLGTILPDVSALQGKCLVKPFWAYAANFSNIVMIPFLPILFLYGLFRVFWKSERREKFLGFWFLIFFIGISFTPEKDLRYALLILPSVLLIAGIGLEKLLEKFFPNSRQLLFAKTTAICCLLLFFLSASSQIKRILDADGKKFAGYREAGQYLKQNASATDVIMAGSPRAIRYYSGMNFQEFGGNIIPLPENAEKLKTVLKKIMTPIFLEVDYWEGTQPGWVYPLPEATIKILRGLNFKLVYSVEKKVILPGQNKKIMPVVWIFRRD